MSRLKMRSSLLALFLLLCAATRCAGVISLAQITNDDPDSIDWAAEVADQTINAPSSATDSLTPLQAAAKYNAIKLIAALLSHGNGA